MSKFKFVVRYSSGNSLAIEVEAENEKVAEEICAGRMGRATFASRLDLETGKLYHYELLTDSWVWVV